jgi:hypothetical protein
MQDEEFEWDDAKAAENWRRHGVTMRQGAEALSDPFAIEDIDESADCGEERINAIAMRQGAILHVTYTERGDRIRSISARRATKDEEDDYYRQNAP